AELCIGRLAVTQAPTPIRRFIGAFGAVASALLTHYEQQADARLAVATQLLDSANLGGEDALGIARPAPIETVALGSAGKERRHRIEVGRQHDVERSQCGENVEASVGDRLRRDRVAETTQVVDQPTPHLRFQAGGGVDVDQGASQGYRIHDSSSVRVSVRESRYFTMTGVESARPQSGPLPAVTARAPGTTTAPSGTIRGVPSAGLMISPRTRAYKGVEPARTVPPPQHHTALA